jgi:hypothetical protein
MGIGDWGLGFWGWGPEPLAPPLININIYNINIKIKIKMYSTNGIVKKFERNIFTESITIIQEDENKLSNKRSSIIIEENNIDFIIDKNTNLTNETNNLEIKRIDSNQMLQNQNQNLNNLEKILSNPNLNLSTAIIKKYKQLDNILNLKIINLSELRSISWNGLPFGKF